MKKKLYVNPSEKKKEQLLVVRGKRQKVIILYKNRLIKLPLSRVILIKGVDLIYIPSEIEQLQTVMEYLRSPQTGCPWDIEQTHQSLLRYLVEETYEYCEAVARGDNSLILEELGDVLLQVVFHCQIAKEQGDFDLDLCAKQIKDKLIFRHPHVFGKNTAINFTDVEIIWKKQKDKEVKNKPSDLTSLNGLPPIIRIEKMIDKLKNGYNLGEIDKNTYKRIIELTRREEIIEKNLGELLLSIIIFGKIKDVNITYQLEKAINSWKNSL